MARDGNGVWNTGRADVRKNLRRICHGTILLLAILHQVKSYGQIQIPRVIKVRFMEDFISAANTKWTQRDSSTYEVTFYHQSQTKDVLYSKDGLPIQTTTFLTSTAQVPDRVQKSLRRFDHYIIDQITEKEADGKQTFDVDLFNERKMIRLSISPTGKIIHKYKLRLFNR